MNKICILWQVFFGNFASLLNGVENVNDFHLFFWLYWHDWILITLYNTLFSFNTNQHKRLVIWIVHVYVFFRVKTFSHFCWILLLAKVGVYSITPVDYLPDGQLTPLFKGIWGTSAGHLTAVTSHWVIFCHPIAQRSCIVPCKWSGMDVPVSNIVSLAFQ